MVFIDCEKQCLYMIHSVTYCMHDTDLKLLPENASILKCSCMQLNKISEV